VGFGSPADFDIDDKAALCNLIEHIGYFLGNLAGPDIKLICTKMTKKDLEDIGVKVDSKLYNACPQHALVTVQVKCRTAKVGVEALTSLDPCFFL
jgi:hypothetical protein